jgi:hypothetical protein
MKSYGLDVDIVTHKVLLNYPLSASLKIVYPPEKQFTASLTEKTLPGIHESSLENVSKHTKRMQRVKIMCQCGMLGQRAAMLLVS